MCFMPCLCLDPCVYALFSLLILRSMSLCTPCHVHVSRSTCRQLCHVLLQPFCLDITLSCVLVLQVGCRSRFCGLGLHQRVWIVSFMHVCTCLLLCFISMFAYLDLGFAMLCTLCGFLWVCAYRSLGPLAHVDASIPLVTCLDVITCETHFRDVGVLNTHIFLLCAMLCLPSLLCASRLAFFASLHFCTLAQELANLLTKCILLVIR